MILKHKIIILLLVFGALMCVPQTWALPLTANGRAAGRIYLARQALPGEKTAAAELQNYLGRISGCEFFISQKMSGCCIILGTVDTPGIPPEAQQMLAGRKDESYWLKTGKNRLYIIGKTQVGTLYGVYGLLSDHLGVCWFNPA